MKGSLRLSTGLHACSTCRICRVWSSLSVLPVLVLEGNVLMGSLDRFSIISSWGLVDEVDSTPWHLVDEALIQPANAVLALAVRPQLSFFFLLLLLFWPCHAACGIFVPQWGIKPVPPAVETWNPNHCTTRECPGVIVAHQVAGYQWVPRSRYAVDACGWMEVHGESCLYSLGWSYTFILPKVSCVPFLWMACRPSVMYLPYNRAISIVG